MALNELTPAEIRELQETTQSGAESTDEQKQQAQLEAERQRCVAFSWMTQNSSYVQNKPNADKIAAYLRENNLPFTAESLDAAFRHLQTFEELDLTPAPEEPTVAPAPAADACPWRQPLDKAQLRVMSKEEMRAILKNKKWSRLFEEEVRNLKITKTGEIR